jgi:hypothetical protein
MGGNLEGRTLLFNRHGGTGGSTCLFHSAPPPFLVPSRSTRSVRSSSHPHASQGGRPRPDPEPDVHASSLVCSLGFGRFPSLVVYGGQYDCQSGRSTSSSLSSIGQSPTNSKILRGWSNSSDMSHWGSLSSNNASVPPGLINLSILGPLSPFASPSPTEMAPVTSPPLLVVPQPNPIPLPTASLSCPSRPPMITLPHGISFFIGSTVPGSPLSAQTLPSSRILPMLSPANTGRVRSGPL